MSSWTPKKWVVLFFPICFSKKALDFGATPVDTHTVTESAGFGLQKFEEWKESSFWVGVLTNRYGSSFTQKTSWKKYGPSPVEVGSFSPLFIGFGYISSGAEFQPTRVEIRGSPWSPCAFFRGRGRIGAELRGKKLNFQQQLPRLKRESIWVFPKIGVPPNHPF